MSYFEIVLCLLQAGYFLLWLQQAAYPLSWLQQAAHLKWGCPLAIINWFVSDAVGWLPPELALNCVNVGVRPLPITLGPLIVLQHPSCAMPPLVSGLLVALSLVTVQYAPFSSPSLKFVSIPLQSLVLSILVVKPVAAQNFFPTGTFSHEVEIYYLQGLPLSISSAPVTNILFACT